MRRIVALFVLILVFASTYLHAQIIDETKYARPIKVTCVGNNITFGSGIPDRVKNSYPSQLALMLGDKWEVRNFGVSGTTLLSKEDKPYINETAYKNASAWQPDVVLIKLGVNDSKPQNWEFKDGFETDYLNLIGGSACAKRDMFTQWSKSLHLPWLVVFADELKPVRHVLHFA